MAEVVLRQEASAVGLAEALAVDSAGIAADVGFDIDRRARRALERRGYGPVSHRGRQFEPAWLKQRDLVVAMEESQVRWLENRSPKTGRTAAVRLLLSYPTGRAGHVAHWRSLTRGTATRRSSSRVSTWSKPGASPCWTSWRPSWPRAEPVRSQGSPSSC